ncbi:hypothetical protein [Arsenicicoccus dermatophilus]|uniref:hypothetical protein n=1 Tax=Arsenicicoccus dermatophilus TaxID=1076331 RepID=UPI001F4CABCD|nr:hypothetical protein [Arsenicicoccus dermatophilus]MCH8614359.1 hypothetical protein [Arsenicicoccus dermatophilus]
MTYLPALQGPRAPWEQVLALSQDCVALEKVGAAAWVSTRCLPEDGRDPAVHQHEARTLAECRVSALASVRRPASYQGMTNSIGRMCLPSLHVDGHAGWYESRNEQDNYRDLLLARPVVDMSTQAMRLEWALPGGVRSHVPDALLRSRDGRITLVDVTRRARLEDPRLVAVLVLTRATADALGWRYEVRTELTPQRRRNVSFVYSHRHVPDHLPADWAARIQGLGSTTQLRGAAVALGTRTAPAYAAVFHLVARRHLFLDLDSPLTADAPVSTRPFPPRRTQCLPAH